MQSRFILEDEDIIILNDKTINGGKGSGNFERKEKSENAIEDATGRLHDEHSGQFTHKPGGISKVDGGYSVIEKKGKGMFPIDKKRVFKSRHEAELFSEAVIARQTLKKGKELSIEGQEDDFWVAYQDIPDLPVPSTKVHKSSRDAEKVKLYLEEPE